MEKPAGFERAPDVVLEKAAMTDQDIAAYIEIEKSIQNERTYSPLLDEAEVREAFEHEEVFFIRIGNEIVGNVSFKRESPEHVYISGLVIRPEYQGNGLGRKTMEKMLEILKEVPLIALVTHPENERAIALYESLGFEKGEIKEDYFGDGEPRMVMTLKRPK